MFHEAHLATLLYTAYKVVCYKYAWNTNTKTSKNAASYNLQYKSKHNPKFLENLSIDQSP